MVSHCSGLTEDMLLSRGVYVSRQIMSAMPSRPVKSCQVSVCIFERISETAKLSYLSLTLILGHFDLFQHLRPLFHHQGLLVGVG